MILHGLIIEITALSALIAAQGDGKSKNETNCRVRNRKINSDRGDLYKVVETCLGDKLMLQCHFW